MKQPGSSKQRQAEFLRNRGKESKDGPESNVLSAESKPGEKKKPDKAKRRKYLKEYWRWLWPYRWGFLTILLLALVTTGLDMVWPLAIRHIMDHVLVNTSAPAGQRMGALMRVGGLIVFVLIFKQALDTIRSLRTAGLDAKVTIRLRRRLFDKFLRLGLGKLSDFKTGGIVSRLSSDVDAINGLVQMAILSPTVAAIRLVLTLSVLVWMSWRLAVGSLIMLPPLALLSLLWLRKVRPVYKSAQQDRQDVDARVNETFGGIRVVRAFRREPREEKSYALGRHTVLRKFLWAIRMETALETVWGLLIPGTVLMIVWYGGYLVIHGKANVGDLFAFQIFAALLLQPVWAIVSSFSQTNKSMSALERVFEVLEMPIDKPDAEDAVDAPRHVREVRFDQVNFEYRPGMPVIRDFSLSVPGGSVVALVGPSGAGKTTLTDLVARFYDPTSGAILLNGIDLRRLRLRSYRSLLAVVQQDTFLFDGTVRENIAYGRRGVTQEQIDDAARRANALEFIRQLPEGFDTLIGERGFKLSGGQKQRISIARAILADPQILILDEATSNLDTESEQLIQASLNELLRHRTTFVIAHRLSTITHADVIVVMDQGRIVETGSHDELMARGGMYAEMVERQRNSMGVNGELEAEVARASRP
jgi:ATP-binding cassette subfamily B protein/subfamily B ATP-binding cassette protein MsbA